MLKVQEYLLAGNTLQLLQEQYGIKHRFSHDFPELVSLKYDQIHSPMGEKICQECRGLILNERDNWNIVAQGYLKFFNYGEGLAAPIDWLTARYQEKVDGSLCNLYWYGNRWNVATTGTPDAFGEVGQSGRTFSELFWETLGGDPFTPSLTSQKYNYLFELTGPLNRVVIPHATAGLTLLGGRNVATGNEVRSEDLIWKFNVGEHTNLVRLVKEFPLQSIDDVMKTFSTMSPLSQEGYVVVDANFNRVKVKHPGYVAMHHAKDGMTLRAFVEIARTGEVPEVIAAFPELKPMLDDAQARMVGLLSEVTQAYDALRNIESQKEFALGAMKTRCSGALFAVRSKKAESFKAYFRDMHLDSLLKLLWI